MCRDIVILSGNYPPESGGPSKFAQNFSKWASSEFKKVYVISTDPNETKRMADGNVEVNLVSRKYNLLIRCLMSALLIRKFAKNASIVLANGLFYEVLLASILFRVKYCVKIPGDIVWEKARTNFDTNLDMYQFQKSRLSKKYRLMRYLFSLSLKRSEMVIVPSNVMYQICLGWKIDPLKIKVIFNSVDAQKFYPTKNQIKKFDVVTVSRLIDIKQIEGVIKAASKLNLKLLIVGSGPEEQALRNLNQNLGNPATFFGNAEQGELPDIYRSARFFVLNSEFEAGTPYSLLEARASGLVCIANERTGAADVITHYQDGFLCGPINKSDLLLNLRRATELGDKYSTFSELARKRTLANFSETSIYSAIISNCERR